VINDNDGRTDKCDGTYRRWAMDTKVKDNFNIGTDLMMRVGDAWVGRERRATMQVINPSSGWGEKSAADLMPVNP